MAARAERARNVFAPTVQPSPRSIMKAFDDAVKPTGNLILGIIAGAGAAIVGALI